MTFPRWLVRWMARHRTRLPKWAWPYLVSLRSLAGRGPVVGVPGFRRALVLAAHPDDEVIGCGGLIALLADAGAQVQVCFATDGEATIGSDLAPDEIARTRRGEAAASCAVLGAEAPRFFGHPDGALRRHATALVADVRAAVAAFAPDVVLAPWELDGHDDHQALWDAVPAGVPRWGYEVWTPLPASWIVDVTAVHDRKVRAMQCYATAARAFDTSAMLALGRYRSVHGLMGQGHAEAFAVGAISGPEG